MTLVLQQMSAHERWLVLWTSRSVACCMRTIFASLLSNDPDQLQRMLDKLGFYAARNELVVNEKKSVVMHFGRSDVRVPVLKYRGSELAAVDSFKYLGMTFTRVVSITATAEQVVSAFQGGCLRVRKFVSEHGLVDRPHTLLWLAKAYVIPASMYGSQIWGTGYRRRERRWPVPCRLVIFAF